MRVAFFCPHSDPLAQLGTPDSGGQCVYERHLAEKLTELGHEVRVYTRQWGRKAEHTKIGRRVKLFRCPIGPEGFLRKEDFGPHLREFVRRTLVADHHWLKKAHLLHGHYWDGGQAATLAGQELGNPVVFTSHSLGALKAECVPDRSFEGTCFRYEARAKTEKRIVRQADGVVALSRMEKQFLIRWAGIPASKIGVIPGGVDVELFAPSPNEDNERFKRSLNIDSDHIVLSVGRLDPRKGFLEMLQALPRVEKAIIDHGRTVTFLLLSGGNVASELEESYWAELITEAARLGLQESLMWLPFVSQETLRYFYALADVLVCPSLYEPFGLVVLEALSSGTPVVASDFVGAAEIVSHGQDGYVADSRDAVELADRILKILLATRQDKIAMSKSARAKVEANYTWDVMARRVLGFYDRTLRNRVKVHEY